MWERRNSIDKALESILCCTNPSIWCVQLRPVLTLLNWCKMHSQSTPKCSPVSARYEVSYVWSKYDQCCACATAVSCCYRTVFETSNSLAPGKFEWNFRYIIFKQILEINGWGIFCEITLIWMSLDFADDQSTLDQVMAWCHQALSGLSQCWHTSLSQYDVTRPEWVNYLGLIAA